MLYFTTCQNVTFYQNQNVSLTRYRGVYTYNACYLGVDLFFVSIMVIWSCYNHQKIVVNYRLILEKAVMKSKKV